MPVKTSPKIEPEPAKRTTKPLVENGAARPIIVNKHTSDFLESAKPEPPKKAKPAAPKSETAPVSREPWPANDPPKIVYYPGEDPKFSARLSQTANASFVAPEAKEKKVGSGVLVAQVAPKKDVQPTSVAPVLESVQPDVAPKVAPVQPSATVQPVQVEKTVQPVAIEPETPKAQPVAPVKKAETQQLTQPVARGSRVQPPTKKGYQWKPDGKSGYSLYTRESSISENGKRSSKAKYVGYYSQGAIERLHNAKQKKND